MADTVISPIDLPAIATGSMANSTTRDAIHLVADDANESPIKTVRVSVQDVLDKASVATTGYKNQAKTSHGLVTGDIGKAIGGFSILNDAVFGNWPTGVLVAVPDANTITIAPPGTDVTLPVALLESGASTDLAVTGRYFYWDLSAGKYSPTFPKDSQIPSVLEVITVGATEFTARVRRF